MFTEISAGKQITTRFYTNGEYLIYDDDGTYGKIYCRKADGSGKIRTILNLKKSGDNVSVYRLYGRHLYYSTYHIYTAKYRTYRINVTGKTGKKKISGTYWMASDLNERKADIHDDRYMPLTDKHGRLAVYDDLTGKMRKLTNKKARTQIARVGNDWYYAVSQDASKKKPAITVYKKVASGAGKATKIAAFAKKGVTLDTMAEMTADGIYFDGRIPFTALKRRSLSDQHVMYGIISLIQRSICKKRMRVILFKQLGSDKMIKKFKHVEGRYIEMIDGQTRLAYALSRDEDFYDIDQDYKSRDYPGSQIIFFDLKTGNVDIPFKQKLNVAYGNPIYTDGAYYFLQADFNEKRVYLYCYSINQLKIIKALDMVQLSLYNLEVIGEDVHIISQNAGERLRCYYPEVFSFTLDDEESAVLIDQNKVYLSKWVEEGIDTDDYKYYERTVVKDFDGHLLSDEIGSLSQMSDGSWWMS